MYLVQISFISSTLPSSAEMSRPRGLHNILYFVPRCAGRFYLEVSGKSEAEKDTRFAPYKKIYQKE